MRFARIRVCLSWWVPKGGLSTGSLRVLGCKIACGEKEGLLKFMIEEHAIVELSADGCQVNSCSGIGLLRGACNRKF